MRPGDPNGVCRLPAYFTAWRSQAAFGSPRCTRTLEVPSGLRFPADDPRGETPTGLRFRPRNDHGEARTASGFSALRRTGSCHSRRARIDRAPRPVRAARQRAAITGRSAPGHHPRHRRRGAVRATTFGRHVPDTPARAPRVRDSTPPPPRGSRTATSRPAPADRLRTVCGTTRRALRPPPSRVLPDAVPGAVPVTLVLRREATSRHTLRTVCATSRSRCLTRLDGPLRAPTSRNDDRRGGLRAAPTRALVHDAPSPRRASPAPHRAPSH